MVGHARRVEPDARIVAEFNANYVDAFSVAPPSRHLARDWAYYCVGGADAAGGVFSRSVWGGLLGFRLARRAAPNTFVGWRVIVDEPDRFVVDTDGRLMAGRMAFLVSDGAVTWTTMLRYHRRAAARIWSAAGHVHRALAQRLLADAARSLERRAARNSADG